MFRGDIVDGSSDEESTNEPFDGPSSKILSCDDLSCAAKFSNLSKLNKHRNGHLKPYECLEVGCSSRFAQKQSLDRHTQTQHKESSYPTKLYHCTVDGCRYASTSQRRRGFARADQAKEHIKDYGHYGPESANDRKKRPGNHLFTEHVIPYCFEEWTLETHNSAPKRALLSFEFNSLNTMLWHTDDTGDSFISKPLGFPCSVTDCYYGNGSPIFHVGVNFRTLKSLEEHTRRVHRPQRQVSSVTTDLQLQGRNASVVGSSSTDISGLPSIDSISDLTTLPFEISRLMQPWDVDSPFSDELTRWSSVSSYGDNEALSSPEVETNQASTSLTIEGSSQILPSNWEMSPASGLMDSISPLSSLATNYGEGYFGDIVSTNDTRFANPGCVTPKKGRIVCEYPQCRRSFKRKGDMLRHLETLHQQTTSFACGLCPRKFKRKDHLRQHVRNVHKDFSLDSGSYQSSWLESPSMSANVTPGNTLSRGDQDELT